jgi:hypothetical protein
MVATVSIRIGGMNDPTDNDLFLHAAEVLQGGRGVTQHGGAGRTAVKRDHRTDGRHGCRGDLCCLIPMV